MFVNVYLIRWLLIRSTNNLGNFLHHFFNNLIVLSFQCNLSNDLPLNIYL